MVSLARKAGVSPRYVRKVLEELTVTGCLWNPCATQLQKKVNHDVDLNFTLEEELFLLALRIECPFHPNTDYVAKLKDNYNGETSRCLRSWFGFVIATTIMQGSQMWRQQTRVWRESMH
jgi:hypothetical protein